MSENDIRQISIRLPDSTYQKAREIAKKKGLSFNGLILQLVSDFFDKESETLIPELIRRIEELEKRMDQFESK